MSKRNLKYRQIRAMICAMLFLFSLCACGSNANTPDEDSVAQGWGDNGGGRESVTLEDINGGALGDQIVFNVLPDGPIGDEKNFVGAREVTGENEGANNVWTANEIDAKDGQKYFVRIFVDNCNPNGLDAVSENTRVAFNVPEESGTVLVVNGYIYSDNASPSEYWDSVCFRSDTPFHLEYEYGSASLENNGIGSNGAVPLGDEIVTKAHSEHGVQIGYETLDGKIPGGSTYGAYISIQVTTVFDN